MSKRSKKLWWISVGTLIILIVFLWASFHDPGHGAVLITVQDENGTGLAECAVGVNSLDGKPTAAIAMYTSADGTIEPLELTPGHWIVVANCPIDGTYFSSETTVEIKSREQKIITITVEDSRKDDDSGLIYN